MKRCVFLLAVLLVFCMSMTTMAQKDPLPYRDDDGEGRCETGECNCICGCDYCQCGSDYDDYEDYDYDYDDYDYDDYEDYDDYDDYGFRDGVCDCGCDYCGCGTDSDEDGDYYEDYSWVSDVVLEYAEDYETIVIVDLNEQHAFCCVDGEIIDDADCVSGDLYNSPTPKGLYSIWGKQKDYYVYDTYYSEYAIFSAKGATIYDADAWRSDYGGTIYKGDGSNGSIDVPGWFAEVIYNNTTVGTPIYIF